MKKRLQKEITLLLILLAIGLAYLVFVLLTGLRIPCLIKLVSGFDCPGCGITRMFVSIARLDFVAAFRYNPVVFVTLPIIAGCIVYERISYIKTGQFKLHLVSNVVLWSEIVLLLIYGIIRNIG